MLTVYKASAGSGKTFNLALRYITLLLGIKVHDENGKGGYVLNSEKYSPFHRRIASRHSKLLAITFTNKATSEMKERIVKQLELLSKVPSSNEKDTVYAQKLTKLYGCSREELADVAAKALRELLCDYSQFNVSTIDSFFQTVLRTFAREVNHQGDYSIELSDTDAVEAGIGMMLDEINFGDERKGKTLKRWIDKLVAKKILDGSRFNVFDSKSGLRTDLRRFVEHVCQEPYRMRAKEMETYLSSDAVRILNLKISTILDKTLPDKCREIAMAFRKEIDSEGVDISWLKNNFETILKNLEKGEIPEVGAVGLKAPVGFQKWLEWTPGEDVSPLFFSTKVPKHEKKPLFPSVKFVEAGKQFAISAREIFAFGFLLEKMLEGCRNLEFLGYVTDYIAKYRKENNIILLSDTNELLHRIINDEELPFVYERLGVKLSNLLIDEFQDTSRMQWNNLKPLVANSISGGNDNLIIGDVKQAIYRFRNSDSSMLAHSVEKEDFPNYHEILGLRPEENSNYRSAHTIVRFNNTLFRALSEVCEVEGYEGVTQSLPPETKNLPGYVRLDFYKKDNEDGPDPVLENMAQDILRQHSSGYNWKDISILVRKQDEGVKIVDYLLTHHPEIAVISDESLLLGKSRAVQIIVSMLRIVDEAYNFTGISAEEAEKRIFSSRKDVSNMISRYNYHLGNGFESGEALQKAVNDQISEAEDIRSQVYDIVRRRPANPVALVETIIATHIGEDLLKNDFAFIAAFQDIVDGYFSVHPGTIGQFLQWWELHKGNMALSSSSNVDAVSIMTIHKSKGLEWPCVHIPFCSWEMSKATETLWYDVSEFFSRYLPELSPLTPPMLLLDSSSEFSFTPLATQYEEDLKKQIADNLNTTYVAFTRAGNELIISGRCSESKTKGISYKGVGKYIYESIQLIDEKFAETLSEFECLIPSEKIDEKSSLFSRYILGEPTRSVREDRDKSPNEENLEDSESVGYDVVLREDARELVAVNDLLTELTIEIGNEEIKSDTEEEVRSSETLLAAEYGNLIHSVLSSMKCLDDFEKAFAIACRLCRVSSIKKTEIHSFLSHVLERDKAQVSRWFSNDVDILFERDLYDPNTDEIIRPDRVVLFPDGHIEVVDYKTTVGESEKNKKQVRRYMELLNKIYPDKIVEGYLWYMKLNKIVKL